MWASTISAWYNQAWGLGRALLLAFLLIAITPLLHVGAFAAVTLPLRVPALGAVCRLVCAPAYRWSQVLYTGTIVSLMESIAGVSLLFSGKVAEEFWRQSTTTTTTDTPTTAPSRPQKRDVTVFMSNQPSHTCFLDTINFFSLAYRRQQMSSLYFLPIDMSEWRIGSCLLYLVFLSPLTVTSPAGVDLLMAQSTSISFVWFPESTSPDDSVSAGQAIRAPAHLSASTDLLHVRTPRLSKLFVHLMSTLLVQAEVDVRIVECTLAYSGSVRAELEERQADAVANAYGGAIDDMEEAEFEEMMRRDGERGESMDDEEADGYSAETINFSHGSITTRRKRKFEPTIPVFCTAAPLRPVDAEDRPESTPAPGHPIASGRPLPSSISESRQALARVRVVPSFYDYLSGNAPLYAHVLLNEYDKAYLTSRVLKLEDCFPSLGLRPKSAASKPTAARQLTEAQEQDAGAGPLVLALSSWLQQRFLHQEQQLTLFAVHSRFHALPASLSASSIPISAPLESFTVPVSSLRLATYVIVDWCIIVLGTIAFRNGRAWWNQPMGTN